MPQVFMGLTPVALAVVAALVSFGIVKQWYPDPLPKTPVQVATLAALKNHSAEFVEQVVKVTPNVYCAVGFGLANSIMIEGDDGVIIVDVLESAEAAVGAKAAFERITKKPIKAIIITHNHHDHIGGGAVFAANDKPDVYSHATLLDKLDKTHAVVNVITFRRAMRQFGTFLTKETGHVNSGIGPKLVYHDDSTPAIIRPNKVFEGKEMTITIAGVELVLIHAPGETDDQIVVWMPKQKVLMAADDIYKAYPNIYAIRGTPNRDAMQWVRSIDEMRELRAEFLVPSHTMPVTGAKQIEDILVAYRDGIQFVHDQTVRYMNLGLFPDEIVQLVKLPPHLANHPYLQEFYGSVEWSSRGIYTGYEGWFSGKPSELSPESPLQKAKRLVDLVGGRDKLLDKAKSAVAKEEWQWALELSDAILETDSAMKETVWEAFGRAYLPSSRFDQFGQAARNIKVQALRELAARQKSANGRNYYLTAALEEDGLVLRPPLKQRHHIVLGVPLEQLFAVMSVNLNAYAARDVDTLAAFRFPDVNRDYFVHVRRGVAETQPRFPTHRAPDLTITVNLSVWRELLAQTRSPTAAVLSGHMKIEGTGVAPSVSFASFMRLFSPENK